MKRLCFVTAARSEYGLLKWLMKEVDKTPGFELKLIVTGGHLLHEQGFTVEEIKADGFNADAEIAYLMKDDSAYAASYAMGDLTCQLADVFNEMKPDCLIVLGDRFELISICSTALIMGIPIVHLCGGDVTEGAIDDKIRNAVTMMATYHFAGSADSADNIIRMTGKKDNIWVVGEPSIENIVRNDDIPRAVLATELGLDVNKEWVLYTCHPETENTIEYSLEMVRNSIEVLLGLDNIQIIATYANADPGGKRINEYLEEVAQKERGTMIVRASLGVRRYLSMLKQVGLVIGNSSSGIVETPFFRVPTVNLGNRQKGRYTCSNIISCGIEKEEIAAAIESVKSKKTFTDDAGYWGDGKTSSMIVRILKEKIYRD